MRAVGRRKETGADVRECSAKYIWQYKAPTDWTTAFDDYAE